MEAKLESPTNTEAKTTKTLDAMTHGRRIGARKKKISMLGKKRRKNAPGQGRPVMTAEQKIHAKALRELKKHNPCLSSPCHTCRTLGEYRKLKYPFG